VRMVGSRQFGASFIVMGATGAILYATTQFLPLMLQTDFGYTATWAGLVLSPGGLVTMVMMFVVGQISSRIQPKYLIMIGAIFAAISMYQLTNVYGDLGFWFFARTRMILGVGLPLILIPIMTASYDGIPPNRVDMASALINAARNTGGSIGVSLAANVLEHREQFHQSRLIENAIPSSTQYQDTLHQVTQYFLAQGSLPPEAQQQAFSWIGQQVQAQSSYLAYIDVFWVLMMLALLSIPLALTLRKVKLGGGAPTAHVSHLANLGRRLTLALTRRYADIGRREATVVPTRPLLGRQGGHDH
jgi:MFS transporter, DHA2 family, multidrug resistance protein